MPKKTINHEKSLMDRLRKVDYAIDYLKAALEDKDELSDAVFILAVRDVAKATKGLNLEALKRRIPGS